MVAKYMVRLPKPPSQTWRTFQDNHVPDIAGRDFFTLPTAIFRVLYIFIVLRHDRRQVFDFNVTTNPNAEWTAQQIVNAFPSRPGVSISCPRPRWHLRRLLQESNQGYGYRGSSDCTTFALAESLLRASDRQHTPRLLESIDSAQRKTSVSHPYDLFRLLSQFQTTLVTCS